jgi:serine protease Do
LFKYFANSYIENANGTNTLERSEAPILTQESFVINTVKKTSPGVVSIILTKEVPKYELDTNQRSNPFGDFFPNFFFNVPRYKQNGTEEKEVGGGSGFIVSSDGLIVTNRHVVEDSDVSYTVFTNDGEKHSAKVVALDPVLDIAFIKIDENTLTKEYPYLALGDSDKLEIGQSVIAIGNSLGEFRNTVSVGVISGLARSIIAGDYQGSTELLDQVIQTDAAINPGNSGGPLLDLSGRVVGVNVAIAQGSQNIGFALPINSIKSAVESVMANGKIVRPYLGVRYAPITPDIKTKNNLSVDYGVIVKGNSANNELAVVPGSPADKAGIVENDIILEVDGKKLDESTSLASIIRQKNIGDVVTLKIIHKGSEKTVEATLEALKGE